MFVIYISHLSSSIAYIKNYTTGRQINSKMFI